MKRAYDLWIDGEWRAAASGDVVTRTAPSDGTEIAAFALGNETDIDAAVRAARRAYDSGVWSEMPGSGRAAILNKWADLMLAKVDELSRIEAEEAGKPFKAAKGELEYSIELTRYAAALAWEIPGRVQSHSGLDKLGLATYEARGVVGMILPWNFPAVCLFQKLPYALAAGCATVIKPAEFTSGTTLEVASLAHEAGVPAGIINVVSGKGSVVGRALVEHAGIDMISFTGSTAVGRDIAQQAGARLKHVALELGGKGANIVFADADIDAALEGALAGFTINKGEECCAGSRLLVEESIAPAFIARLAEKAKAIRVGSPSDEGTEMGPLIHQRQLERVEAYAEKGVKEGARLVTGGKRLTEGSFGKGCYFPPTIFADVTPEMTIFKEEIFGPVVSVMTFRTAEEAIRIANDTCYGLANGVWSKDINKAVTVARRVKSGMVYVNTYLETIPQLPFGGMKESGKGRENGREGLLEFMETKAIFVKLSQI